MWDVQNSKLETVAKGHGYFVISWELFLDFISLTPIKIKQQNRDPVLAVQWNPNGRSFVSCGKQKSVILWND